MSLNSTRAKTRNKISATLAAILLAIAFACSMVGLTQALAPTRALADDEPTATQPAATTAQDNSKSVRRVTARDALELSPQVITARMTQLPGISIYSVDLENAYLSIADQTVAAPAHNIAVPTNKDFVFSVAPIEGYEISTVQFQMKSDAITNEEKAEAEALNRVAGLYDLEPTQVAATDPAEGDAVETVKDVYTIAAADLENIQTIIVKAVPKTDATATDEPAADTNDGTEEAATGTEPETASADTSTAAGTYTKSEDPAQAKKAYETPAPEPAAEQPQQFSTFSGLGIEAPTYEGAPDPNASSTTEQPEQNADNQTEEPAPYQAVTYNEAATMALQGETVLDPDGNLVRPTTETSGSSIETNQTIGTPEILLKGSNFGSTYDESSASDISTIAGDLPANKNALQFSGNDISFTNDDRTATVTGNGTLTVKDGETYNGNIVINGGNVTIKGGGTINASAAQTSAITIKGGATVTLAGNVTVTGGKGTLITDGSIKELEPRGDSRVGGGVFVEDGTFNLQSGTITGNTAQRGGGVFVNHKAETNKKGVTNTIGATFNMTGGTVTANKTVDKTPGDQFAGEGGGIFVWGIATISGGEITNNVCNSQTDLGGGGLYVNNGGIATLVNAEVTGNTAYGWGGGIAGCCHGETSLVATDGVALFGNTANGKTHTLPKYWDTCDREARENTAEVVDHYKASKANGINADNAKDFYTAGSTIVSNYMAGGGSAKYTGRVGNTTTSYDLTVKDDEVLKFEGYNVGLTANPSDESKALANAVKAVTISGNTSTVHGGGIGCNGGLYFGVNDNQKIEFETLALNLTAKKVLADATGKPESLSNGQFSFDLYFKKDGKKAATATCDENGNISFEFTEYKKISDYLNDDKTLTFVMKESVPENADSSFVGYDKSEYEITVTLDVETTEKTETLEHTTDGNTFKNITVTYIKHAYTVKDKTVKRIADFNGNPINADDPASAVTGEITFKNEPKGALKIKKTVMGGNESTASADYTFYVNGPNGYTKEVKVKGGESETLYGLEPGDYTVTEANAGIDGYYWTTSVKDSETASVVYDQTATVDVINKYYGVAKFAPKVTKTITTEHDVLAPEEEFEFTISAVGQYGDEQVTTDVFDTAIIKNENGEQSKDNYVAYFDDITFTQPGIYKYRIVEKQGITPGYTYDPAEWIVTVEVTEDDETGELVATPTYEGVREGTNITPTEGGTFDSAHFDNKFFQPQKTEVTPKDGEQVKVGDEITYEISWKNYKNVPAQVVISDQLDKGVDFVSAGYKGYDVTLTNSNAVGIGKTIELAGANVPVQISYNDVDDNHTVTWTLGEKDGENKVPAHADGVVTLTVRVNENAIQTGNYNENHNFQTGDGEDHMVYNQAGVTVDNDSTMWTDIPQNPVPEKKETTPGNGEIVGVDREIDYVIHWKNGQDGPAVVTVTDPLDAGVDFVSASAGDITINGERQANYYGTYSYDSTSHVVTWTFRTYKDIPEDEINAHDEAPMPAGAEGDVMLKVRVNEKAPLKWQYERVDGSKDYEVVDRAHVQVGNDFKITNEVKNPLPEKTEVTPGNGLQVSVGDEITYNIHWKNSEVKKAKVTITDELDQGVDYERSTENGQYDDATRTVTWEIGEVDPGAEGDVQLTVTVNEKAFNNGSYKEGDYTGTEGKDYEVENQAAVWLDNTPAFTTVVENPVPEKTEVTPGDGVQVGLDEEITYNIHWKNGEAGKAAVTITDQLDQGVDFVSANFGEDSSVTLNDPTATATGTISGVNAVITYDAESRTVKWQLGNKAEDGTVTGVEPGAEGTVQLVVRVNEKAFAAGSYNDKAEFQPGAEGEKDYEVLNQATVEVGNSSAVTVVVDNPIPEKTQVEPGDGNNVKIGDTIDYRIHWQNGKVKPAVVVVTDYLDQGVDFESASFENTEITIDTDNPTAEGTMTFGETVVPVKVTYDPVGRKVVWELGTSDENGENVEGVPEGAEGFVLLTVKVNDQAQNNWQYLPESGEPSDKDYEIQNRAGVKVDNKTVQTEIVENPVPAPHKTETDPGNLNEVYVGKLVTYEITWQNYKDQEAAVTVTDNLDKGSEFVSAGFANGDPALVDEDGNTYWMFGGKKVPVTVKYDEATHTVTWQFGARGADGTLVEGTGVPANTEGKVQLTIRVTEAAKAAGGYNDQAVFGSAPEGTPNDNKIYNQAIVKVDNDADFYTEVMENPLAVVDITARKVWVDENNTYGVRPGSVYAHLWADGVLVDTVQITGDPANNVWTYTWEDLNERAADGHVINYTITESTGEDLNPYKATVTDDGAGNYTITNTIQYGDLSIQKIVAGGAGNTDEDFEFTIELSDKSINETYGGLLFDSPTDEDGLQIQAEFVNGVTTWRLKHGQLVRFDKLPAGVTYTVTESSRAEDEGYRVSAQNRTGMIPAGGVQAEVTYTNYKGTGLTVEKIVTDENNERGLTFDFRVELSDDTITGQYGDMWFENGVAEFSLGNTESATATDLPEGVTYTVTELDANEDGFVTEPASGVYEGTITDQTNNETGQLATFHNIRGSVDLNLAKTVVSDDDADRRTPFRFHVALDDPTINGQYGSLNFTNGEADVALRHGETATAHGLPVGTSYTVTENADDSDGYNVYATGANGTLVYGNDANAHYTNTRPEEDEELGALVIDKIVSGGPADAAANRPYTFLVTGPDGYVQTVTVTGDGDVVLDGLEPGNYTVRELNAAIAGYAWTVEVLGSSTVEAGSEAVTRVVNIYEPEENIPGNPTPQTTYTPNNPNNPNNPGNDTTYQTNESIYDNTTPLSTRRASTSNSTSPTSPQVAETIDDLGVPLASTPKTGDDRNIGMWVGIGVAALVGLGACGAGFFVSSKRRKKDEE